MASAYYRVSTDDDEEEEVIDLTEAIVQPPPRKRQKRAPAEAIDLTCDDDDINIMSVVTVVDLSEDAEEDDIIAVQQQGTTSRGGGAAAAAADCVICMDPLTLALTVSLSCHHQFHTECMKRHILTSIEQMKTPIPCPLCPQASAAGLRDTEVKQFLTKAEIRKYSKAVEQRRVMTDPNLRHCPTPDCTHVYNIEKLKNEKGRGNPHCLQCGNELPLSEAMNKGGDKGEAELQQYVSRNGVRKCRRCSAWVEKHSGCSKMRCICGYKFCYDCGKENATCACTSPNHGFLSTEVRQGNDVYGGGGGLPDHHVLQVFAAGRGAGGRGRSGGGTRAAIAELAGIGGGAAFQQALGRLFGLAER